MAKKLLCIRSIEGWRLAWKFWSVRLGVIGTTVTGLFVMWPESALYFWGVMPDDVKAWIPEEYLPMIGVFIFAMSIIARLVKQPKVDKQIKEAAHESQRAGSAS